MDKKTTQKWTKSGIFADFRAKMWEIFRNLRRKYYNVEKVVKSDETHRKPVGAGQGGPNRCFGSVFDAPGWRCRPTRNAAHT